MISEVYVYTWGNNSKRATLKGRRCVIEASGRMNTVLIRFLDNGERGTVSRRALRLAVEDVDLGAYRTLDRSCEQLKMAYADGCTYTPSEASVG